MAARKTDTLRRGKPLSWRVLIYRVPTEPASKRVGIWRDLKRLGVLYLQQCACIFPAMPGLNEEVDLVADKIPTLGGETFRLEVPRLDAAEEARVIAAFREQRAKEYAEIIEECETKFVKEIEFERFRENYTFEEAEEIEQDLDKIRRWFDRVCQRDWFKAERRAEVEAWLAHCQGLLASFEEDVYRLQASAGDPAARASGPELEDALPAPRPITPIRAVRPRVGRTRTRTQPSTLQVRGERDA